MRRAMGAAEAGLAQHETIEEFEKTIEPQDVPEVVARLKLRRVLLLQDVSRSRRQDVIVAPVTSVKDVQRERANWYERLLVNQVPYLYRLTEARQGVNVESVVNLMQLSTISRATLLRWAGVLAEAEMRSISEKLIDTLELDISGRLAQLSGS